MEYHNIAISVKATKEASLYFDNVIPFLISAELFLDYKKLHKNYEKIILDLVPKSLSESDEFGKLWTDLEFTLTHILMKDLMDKYNLYPSMRKYVNKEEYSILWSRLKSGFRELGIKYNFSNYPIIVPSDILFEKGDEEDIMLTISKFNLIDTEKLSWDKLLEFRKDIEARNRLRKLRLFALENYNNKDKAFIEDDLSNRLYNYNETVKNWEFETKHSVISMLLSSKILATTIGGSLISAFFGIHTLEAAFPICGASIEIGKISLELAKRKNELRKVLKDNPISYITYANDKLNTKNA